MSFLLRSFLLSWFLTCWAFCHFPCARFSSCSSSTAGAFAELGFWCAWPLPHRVQAEVVSFRLNLSHGTIYVRGVCNFLGPVSPQQRFEATDGPALQLFVTAQFYLASKGKYIFEAWGWADPKDSNRREAPLAPAQFWLLFLCFLFSSPCTPAPSLPYVNWASKEGCLFHLRSSHLCSLHRLFPSLSFSHHHFGLLFPILTM